MRHNKKEIKYSIDMGKTVKKQTKIKSGKKKNKDNKGQKAKEKWRKRKNKSGRLKK